MSAAMTSGNAYIDALPPVRETPEEVAQALGSIPPFSPDERLLSHTMRRYCVLRLHEYFKVNSRQ